MKKYWLVIGIQAKFKKTQPVLYKPYQVCIKITLPFTRNLVGKGDVNALYIFYYIFVNLSPLSGGKKS